MRWAKNVVKGAFRAAGLNVSRIRTVPEKPRPPAALSYHGVELVFDVGANTGQYARRSRSEGYQGRIISFEPLPDAYEKLLVNASTDPLWSVHSRAAVGSHPGETEINVAGNSQSSSLLPMLAAHSRAAPESVYVGKARTEVITLDSVFDTYRTHDERTFLKIDTQGFESQVLEGAAASLPHIFGVQLELSVVPLYEGQELYEHFLAFFAAAGYSLWSLLPGFIDTTTGRMLQFDAVFVRP